MTISLSDDAKVVVNWKRMRKSNRDSLLLLFTWRRSLWPLRFGFVHPILHPDVLWPDCFIFCVLFMFNGNSDFGRFCSFYLWIEYVNFLHVNVALLKVECKLVCCRRWTETRNWQVPKVPYKWHHPFKRVAFLFADDSDTVFSLALLSQSPPFWLRSFVFEAKDDGLVVANGSGVMRLYCNAPWESR